jgi:hypothetical protein
MFVTMLGGSVIGPTLSQMNQVLYIHLKINLQYA